MKKIFASLILFSFLVAVPVLRADEGMWTYDNPPLKQWKERYAFEPSTEWLDNIRLASVKIGGGSAGFVSPNGLIVTNHHVASGIIARLSSKERDLLKTGFVARTNDEELKASNTEARVLVSFENVTSRVHGAVKAGATGGQAADQRSAAIEAIEKESNESTGLRSTVVSLYSGGEYWLYRFKVYTDIRLVMAPEEQTAYFGGDLDNFTFPRHDLDYTFLRAYENGKPASTPHYFKWSSSGPKDGEFVIATGFPGSTARLMTVSQLAYARDHGNPLLKLNWEMRRNALIEYSKLGEEQERAAAGTIRGLANSLKRLKGQQDGLLNPRMFAIKVAEEKELRDKLAEKPELDRQYAPAWESVSKAYAELSPRANSLAFSTLSTSRLSNLAFQIVMFHAESSKPDASRFPEYREARKANIIRSLTNQAPFDLKMEEIQMLAWMKQAEKLLGRNDPFIKAAFGDAEVEEVVRRAVRETKLTQTDFRKALVEGPASAISSSTDPMITLAKRVGPVIRELRVWNETNVLDVEAESGIQIAQARFSVYGRSMPPDANGNLRLSYGAVKGYELGTTLIPFKTTFYGLFDRLLSFDKAEPFHLPQRVIDRREKIDLSTPLNFVYTADTIGGNSGSPVINRNAELVGLNFDSNLQKLSNRYWYIPNEEGSRAVAVHSAGILESLKNIYDAPELINEVLGKRAAAAGSSK